jgi:hypothetical protein
VNRNLGKRRRERRVTGAQLQPVATPTEPAEAAAVHSGEQVPPGAGPLPLALRALCLIARLHHVAAEPAHLAHQLGWPPTHVPSTQDLLLAARQLGLKAKLSRSSVDRLTLVALPALALVADDAGGQRVIVLAQCDGQRVLFQDPSEAIQGGRPVIEPLAAFVARWKGELILVASRASLAGTLARFDFSWFIPSLVKYRRLFGEVLVVSLFLQLFALVSPLFFQVVMDKVLVHRGLTTLDVLVIGLTIVVLFESALTILRTYIFSHTTSRIDVELGARLFRHLVNLPLAYFQARRVGDSVARVRELENIRAFLTGNALTLLLDVAFSVIFIAVMFLYSVPLTLIVLVTLPLYVVLSLLIVPVLRSRLNEKFARGAENQALLVETVTGIQTVKANALEPALARRWDNQLAAYVVDNALDVIVEEAGAGIDTVKSAVSWSLGADIENLTLTGSKAISATGNAIDNVLVGNAAGNVISGEAGDDRIDGGAGADTLIGGTGSDTYVLGRGYGADLLQENDATPGNADVLTFLSGIGADQIWFHHVGNDLQVSIIGTSDKATLQNWYLGSQYHIEEFKTSDGKTLLDSKVQDLVNAMAAFTPPAAGQTSLPASYQATLLPIIAADWGP